MTKRWAMTDGAISWIWSGPTKSCWSKKEKGLGRLHQRQRGSRARTDLHPFTTPGGIDEIHNVALELLTDPYLAHRVLQLRNVTHRDTRPNAFEGMSGNLIGEDGYLIAG